MQPDVSITVCVGTNVNCWNSLQKYNSKYLDCLFLIQRHVKIQIPLYIFSLLSLFIQLKLYMVLLHMHGFKILIF